MAYCVANFGKHKRAAVRGLQAEANREMDKGKYKNGVDVTRSAQNIWLVRSDDWVKSINDEIEAAGVSENKNAVVLTTSVYSASPEWFKTHTQAEALAYFQSCLEFERSRGRVINAVIHMDEATPHMQTATVPVVDVPVMECVPRMEKNEDGEEVVARYKTGKSAGKPIYDRKPKTDEAGNVITHKGLNAGYIFGGPSKLSRAQTEFARQCGKPFGMERGKCCIMDAEAAKKHQNEAEYKAGQIIAGAEKKAAELISKARETSEGIMKRVPQLAAEEVEKCVREHEETGKVWSARTVTRTVLPKAEEAEKAAAAERERQRQAAAAAKRKQNDATVAAALGRGQAVKDRVAAQGPRKVLQHDTPGA